MSLTVVIVDFQRDFCREDGRLFVPGASEAKKKILEFLTKEKKKVRQVILTRDRHSPLDKSFKVNGGQWEEHCVRGTEGAEVDEDILSLLKSLNFEFKEYTNKGEYVVNSVNNNINENSDKNQQNQQNQQNSTSKATNIINSNSNSTIKISLDVFSPREFSYFDKGTSEEHEEYGAFEVFKGTLDTIKNTNNTNTNTNTNNTNCSTNNINTFSPLLFSNFSGSSFSLIKNQNVIVCGLAGDFCVLETIKSLARSRKIYINTFMGGIASIDGGTKLKNALKEMNIKDLYDII